MQQLDLDTLPPDLNRQKPGWTHAYLSIGFVVSAAAVFFLVGSKQGLLFVIGGALGLTLYQASFGFTAGFSNLIKDTDTQKMRAQMVMLIAASLLMLPLFSYGEFAGQSLSGKITAISVSMVSGGFLFGVGMQLGGGCASGTLYHLGSGSLRMGITLVAFIFGSLIGTFHVPWWKTLPSLGKFSMLDDWGLGLALLVNIGIALGLYALFVQVEKRHHGHAVPLIKKLPNRQEGFLATKWPLLIGAILLAVLNLATLLVKGKPWGITSGFALWGAKIFSFLGGDLSSSAYWQSASHSKALAASFLEHSTSIMNIGLILGAFWAAKIGGNLTITHKASGKLIVRLLIGGFLLGYGARLSSGCNIGAYFSGIASGSLHGWVWLVVAFLGNVVGYRIKTTAFREAT